MRPGQMHHSGRFIVTITEARLNAGILHAEQECRIGETTWTHSWMDVVYSDHDFVTLIMANGFTLTTWLDDDHEWALLRLRCQ